MFITFFEFHQNLLISDFLRPRKTLLLAYLLQFSCNNGGACSNMVFTASFCFVTPHHTQNINFNSNHQGRNFIDTDQINCTFLLRFYFSQ